ncbi:hypothetical protein BGZ68_000770 [Mortierella alpina]|nr:hypothetical protein BGZ68_000770 [Mortierella alpina]
MTAPTSQPAYKPEQRGKATSILNLIHHDQDYKDPEIKRLVDAEQLAHSSSSCSSSRRGSIASSKNMQISPTRSSPNDSRGGGGGTRRFSGPGVNAPFYTTSPAQTRGDNSGSRTQFHAPLEPEVIAKLDNIFFKFLQRICSDLTACDSKGDHIHQPLMAKKMQRLEASTEFRPFKFRIQAFTNAFHDALVMNGLTEDILPLRKVKVYLWKHRYISRFNEDGKKQKSKGNHVWNIEARKISTSSSDGNSDGNGDTSSNGYHDVDSNLYGPEAIVAAGGGRGVIRKPSNSVKWEFREYSSRIAGQIIKFARVGVPYVYSPRIWDAQMSCPAAKFSSPWLPPWLKWHKGELKGIPGPEDDSCTITVIAEYVREGEDCRLEMSFSLTVSDPSKEGELMDSQNENENENENENDNENENENEHEHEHENENENEHENGHENENQLENENGNEDDNEDELEEEEYDESHMQRAQFQQVQESTSPRHQQQHPQAQSPYQQQAQHQAQHQLQHLRLQEQPSSQLPSPLESYNHSYDSNAGTKSEDDPITSDEPQEMEDDEDGAEGMDDDESPPRFKQPRERRSLLLMQDTKRRKHDQ